MQPARAVDTIIAIDSSSDAALDGNAAGTGYVGRVLRAPYLLILTIEFQPDGTAIYTTYLKSQAAGFKGKYPFPTIPTPKSAFTQRGMNKRPTL